VLRGLGLDDPPILECEQRCLLVMRGGLDSIRDVSEESLKLLEHICIFDLGFSLVIRGAGRLG
jgi:hypothetical protein